MTNAFSKEITDLMRTCILSIFWPKKEILAFFKDNNCSSNDLKGVEKNLSDLKRPQIIDILFSNLNIRSDKGLGQYRSMLRSLIEWRSFDPYWFKEMGKLNKEDAQRNINHLKAIQEIRDAKQHQLRKEREKIENERYSKKKSLEELSNQFTNLYRGKDENNKTINLQQRGYLFESFLRDLAINNSIMVTNSIKIKGEQIDGTIKFDGENYILEAKWQDALTATDALYHFGYKVDGKFYGRGIFISVNGFSSDSYKALVTGRRFQMILIDGADLTCVTEGLISFTELLDKKISAAQTAGKIYVDVFTMKDKIPL